jgi:hypothetical protein
MVARGPPALQTALAQVPGLDTYSFGTAFTASLHAYQRRHFQATEASETFCGLVCAGNPQKVSQSFNEPLREAVCYAAQWLKSSVERLSEKGYEQHSERGLRRPREAKMGRKARFRCSVRLHRTPLRPFSDGLWKVNSRNFALTEFLKVRTHPARKASASA